MREIKFRAWYYDGKNLSSGEMQYNCLVRTEENGEVLAQVIEKGMRIWSNCVKVMQYTGLKDKNNKEIYEGDIVDITILNNVFRGEVIFKDGSFIQKNHLELGRYNRDSIKVIGNIYENPELLKK